MEGILKKAQVLILIAVLVSGIAYLTKPAYAAGIYSETSSMTMAPKFVSARKGAKVTLRWSKAYSVLQDGSVLSHVVLSMPPEQVSIWAKALHM